MPQTVSLSFFRFRTLSARLWAFGQMGLARPALRRLPDVGFHKLFGTGTGEGFTPAPNTAVYAILAVWPDATTAKDRVEAAAIYRRYRARAAESWTLFLAPISTRGRWAGAEPFAASEAPAASASGPDATSSGDAGPIAALTRARLKPKTLIRFWRRVPEISRRIGRDQNVAFKIGMGEVPLMNQVTFSIWPDAKTMADFARADGPHAAAIRAVRAEGWFSEELYARFRILDQSGSWSDATIETPSRAALIAEPAAPLVPAPAREAAR